MTTKTTQKFTVVRCSADLTAEVIETILADAGLVDEDGRFVREGEAKALLDTREVEFWFPAE
jgi:hypothetical protein